MCDDKKPAEKPLRIIETPRDAMQGLTRFIPTTLKIEYINRLLKIGFDIVETGSFVSPAAIYQMHDTADVISGLDLTGSQSKLMALIVNRKGFNNAIEIDELKFLSYPYSASPTFLKKNINRTPEESLRDIEYFRNFCEKKNKILFVYLTMAFGNPYGDMWNIELILREITKLARLDITYISLSDITGESDTERISNIYEALIPKYKNIEFGLHLHSEPPGSIGKVDVAYKAGCRYFDTTINGRGGCPMTGKDLVANLDTLKLIEYLKEKKIPHNLNEDMLQIAAANDFFNKTRNRH